jgi:predicted flavoprotein YhiN
MREATGNKLPATAMGLARLIKSLPIELTGVAGLERAISTAGGINQDSVDERLMLKACPGVFVAGEMLSWDAPTGGYLLQACFSSAIFAAKGIDAWVQKGVDQS